MAPRIQEYLPETEGAQPVGGVSPNLEAINQLGEGVESFGRNVTQTSDVLENRVAGMEAADVQSNVSDAKAEYYDRIQNEVANGNFNQEKVLNDYDDWASQEGAKYDTARGKQEFERASGRTKGMVMRWASQAQIKVNGANEVADHVNTVNNLTNLTEKDPGSWANNIGQYEEKSDGLKNDPYMTEAAKQLYPQDTAKITTAAVLGLAKQDQAAITQDVIANGGDVDVTNDKYKKAQQFLDSGVVDKYLSAEQKNALSKQIRTGISNAVTDGHGAIAFAQKQYTEAANNRFKQIMPQIQNGSYSIAEAYKDPVFNVNQDTLDEATAWIKKAQGPEAIENSSSYNSILSRINSDESDHGHIETAQQLRQAMLTNNIAPRYYSQLATRLGKENEPQRDAEKQLLGTASKIFNSYTGPDGTTVPGMKNDYGGVSLRKFSLALDQAKQEAVSKGEPIAPLYDPSSPKYFGRHIVEYNKSASEIMADLAGSTTRQIAPNMPTPQPGLPAGIVRVKDATGRTFRASRKWLNANPKSGYEEVQ